METEALQGIVDMWVENEGSLAVEKKLAFVDISHKMLDNIIQITINGLC